MVYLFSKLLKQKEKGGKKKKEERKESKEMPIIAWNILLIAGQQFVPLCPYPLFLNFIIILLFRPLFCVCVYGRGCFGPPSVGFPFISLCSSGKEREREPPKSSGPSCVLGTHSRWMMIWAVQVLCVCVEDEHRREDERVGWWWWKGKGGQIKRNRRRKEKKGKINKQGVGGCICSAVDSFAQSAEAP